MPRELDVPLQVIAADDVEDDVDALSARQLADRLDEVGRAVVDRAGAKPLAGCAFLVGAGGREHVAPNARAS